MPQKHPWHSARASVHHNNTECPAGAKMENADYREGTGGKPLCAECYRLNLAGK
jgi:hypothetical protein